jgi:hypothetical protein
MYRELGQGVGTGENCNAHRVAASQVMGTRMVIEAQTEIGPLMPQNSGGPLNVTKMLAAIDSNISDTKERPKVDECTYL